MGGISGTPGSPSPDTVTVQGHPDGVPVPVVEPIPADDLAKVQSTNSTDGTFPSRIPTTTQPTASATRAVLTWAGRSTLFLIPYGTGADNATITGVRVLGWQKISTLWVPTAICTFAGTLSTIVGVSGAAVTDTERFCDTITLTNGIGVVLTSLADNTGISAIEVGIDGFDLVEVIFDLGTATAANCLYNAF